MQCKKLTTTLNASHGPRQTTQFQLKAQGSAVLTCEFKFSSFSMQGKRREYPRDLLEKEYAIIIQEAIAPAVRLDLYPKASIDIAVHVLDCDGSLSALAAAITCASAALIDAGVEMLDSVVASSAGLFKQTVVLDCTTQEELLETGSVLVAYMPSLDQVTHLVQNGEMSLDSSAKVSSFFRVE